MPTLRTRPIPPSESRRSRATGRAWALRAAGAWLLGSTLLGGTALAQSLVNGGAVRGTLSVPGEQHTYTFDAVRNDSFELRLVDVDATALSLQIEVFNPRGVRLLAGASPDVAVIDTTWVEGGLSQQTPAGTYTVVVSSVPGSRQPTGDYDLHFVLAPAGVGEALLDGVMVFGELERGALDVFTFDAAPGQRVEGRITRLSGNGFRLRGEQFGPSGASEGIGPAVHFATSSSVGGTHTVVVSDGSPSADGTGRYSLVVRGITAAPPYPPSVFWPSERQTDPLLLDVAGHSGLGPRIGDPAEPFNVALDCTGAGTPALYLLSLTPLLQAAETTRFGWLYLDGPNTLETQGRHQQSVETWFAAPAGLVLPNDVTLVGRTFTVQGACGGFGRSFRLSNALTQTIGG